jgi:hypothetical protein
MYEYLTHEWAIAVPLIVGVIGFMVISVWREGRRIE